MNVLLDKISRELDTYYKERSANSDASVRVGWKNRQAQVNRFTQIVKVVSKSPSDAFSIGDLGCGLGDFYAYLADMGFENAEYRGYDMAQPMVDGALKLHEGKKGAFFNHISNFSEMQQADYIVASGIFNLKFTIPEHEWLYYILATIEAMNDRSNKGFAFNALSRYSDIEFRREELHYADPLFLFDYCKQKLSGNVALLHDYGEYDFTIIVRKSPPTQPGKTG